MRSHPEPVLYEYGPFSLQGPDLRVVDREVDGVTIIDLVGPLVGDLSVHALPDRIRELLDKGGRDLAINLAGVPYADSCGVASLVSAYRSVRQAGGRIRFFAACERLVHTLERLRLNAVFDLYQDESSAVPGFEKQPSVTSGERLVTRH